MQIQFFQNPISFNNSSVPQRRVKSPLAPLSCDTVSFGAIKKTSLDGFNLACANKFKAPLEKFRSNEDFNLWAKEELEKYFNTEYTGRSGEVVLDARNKILQEWKGYLQEENNIYIKNPALSLIIFSAIVKDLGKNNDNLPPQLNKGVLADTVGQIKENLKKDSKYQFDFNKTYQNNLRMFYTHGIEEIQYINGSAIEGWIRIPSKINDPDNFDKNVDKLKALSHKSWCTKTTHAELYLKDGDFHVYYENGKPKLGIRFIDEEIKEIQGEGNNGKIPVAYFDTVKEYVDKNDFKGAESQIEQAEICKQKLEDAKLVIGNSIENKDYKKILEYFGIKVKPLGDNTFEISHYKQPDEDFTFKDLGIDEEDLFKNISRIKGDANFEYSHIKDLGRLQSIDGYAFFSKSQIKNLGSLQSINGDAYFSLSQIQDLGRLNKIGGNADFIDSQIKDLGNLQSIDVDAYFSNTQIKDLGNLQSIGGDADFSNSQVKDLGRLQVIGGDADFSHSQVKDLGNLQSIGGDADFTNSQITSLGSLNKIGGNAAFNSSQIKDLGNLRSIDGYAEFRDSQITTLGHLLKIGGNANFRDSQLKTLGNLRLIGKNADFKNSQITTLDNLHKIGGNASFMNSNVNNLGNLESIGGDAIFGASPITTLGCLKSIGGAASFNKSQITDLGNLESIGNFAVFENSQITDLGNLQVIGGNAYFKDSLLKDWSNVEIKGQVYR